MLYRNPVGSFKVKLELEQKEQQIVGLRKKGDILWDFQWLCENSWYFHSMGDAILKRTSSKVIRNKNYNFKKVII